MIQQQLGARIKELRTSLGLSQKKFALKIGMNRTYFASVESGKRNISFADFFLKWRNNLCYISRYY